MTSYHWSVSNRWIQLADDVIARILKATQAFFEILQRHHESYRVIAYALGSRKD